MDWGSSLIQSRKRAASISGLLLACKDRRPKNARREGKKVKEANVSSGNAVKKERKINSGTARPTLHRLFLQMSPQHLHKPPTPKALGDCYYPVWLLDDKKAKQNKQTEKVQQNTHLGETIFSSSFGTDT